MRAGVYQIPGRHHTDQLSAMADGLDRHGIDVEFFQTIPPEGIDLAVVWSWRVGLRIREYFSGPILVMERGYLGDRFAWTSLGWDGLNGRARFTKVADRSRFERLFSDLLRPWKSDSGYALIMGQVPGDTALIGVDILKWYRDIALPLWKQGWDIMFRQHPVEVERGSQQPHVPFAQKLTGSLAGAIAGAGLVVTYNSNSGTDAVMAGVPIHASDAGSIVFDLAAHDLQVIRPDREERLCELAWCQWSMYELKSGAAWEVVRESMYR